MKKHYSQLLIIALLFMAGSLNAQNHFKNGFNMEIGFLMPSSDYADVSAYSGTYREKTDQELLIKAITNNDKVPGTMVYDKANMGYAFSVGSMFFINALKFHEQMRVGIDLNYMNFNYTGLKMKLQETNTEFDSRQMNAGIGVGPFFSYSPLENMGLDIGVRFRPGLSVFHGTYSETGGNPQYGDEMLGFGFNTMTSPFFQFRYSILLVGLAYEIGEVKQSIRTSSDLGFSSIDVTSNMNTLRLSLGLKF